MPDKSSEAIGIIGSGPIGQGLATLWAQAGYTVQLGARSPESARRVSVPPSVRVVSFEEAARHKVVVLAVKHSAAQDVVDRLAPLLKRAMVFDVMNAAGMREGQIVSTLPEGRTEGQWMAEMLPDSVVVRAFSHIQEELLVSRAESGRSDMPPMLLRNDRELKASSRLPDMCPYLLGRSQNHHCSILADQYSPTCSRPVISNILPPCIDCLGCWSDSTRVT